jgi:hypothetical protein
MAAEQGLSQRMPRVPEETQSEIVRLAIRQVSQAEIARRLCLHRQTVKRVLQRTAATIAVVQDTEQARGESLAVYREVQRCAWQAVENAMKSGRSPAMLLAEVRQAQQRIDALLGVAPAGDEGDTWVMLAQFKATVVNTIRSEAPEAARVIAQRLLEARNGHGR